MVKNCQKFVVHPKMSTIFSKIVRKQRLHASDFFHVCTETGTDTRYEYHPWPISIQFWRILPIQTWRLVLIPIPTQRNGIISTVLYIKHFRPFYSRTIQLVEIFSILPVNLEDPQLGAHTLRRNQVDFKCFRKC